MIARSLTDGLTVQLEAQGEGRYVCFLCSPGQGRLRIGTVLGGRRSWVAEPFGKAPSIRATSRVDAAVQLGRWGMAQTGARIFAAWPAAGVEKV